MPFGQSGAEEGPHLPPVVSFARTSPHPLHRSASIRYEVPERMNVRLEVLSLLGERVATLVNGVVNPGSHDVDFDASHLSSGVYFCRLEAGNTIATRRLLITK
jgi:hypothetical protein